MVKVVVQEMIYDKGHRRAVYLTEFNANVSITNEGMTIRIHKEIANKLREDSNASSKWTKGYYE